MSHYLAKIFFLLQGAYLLSSCAPKQVSLGLINQQDPITVSALEVNLTYMPQQKRVPTHLVINKSVRYQFSQTKLPESFSKELIVDPLMHQASFAAHVQLKGKTVRKYPAKIIQSPNRAGRAMFSIVVPFLKPDEEVVILSSYNWMDPRLIAPIFMEEAEATRFSKITIDVPYGINLRHRTAHMGHAKEFAPKDIVLEKSVWGTSDNRHGKRFIFEQDFGPENSHKKRSYRQQLFIAFDAPAERDKKTLFENWETVSNYFYNRIDRYDLPSNAVRDFSVAQTSNTTDDIEKIGRIFSFLNSIEKRNTSEPLQEQETQPANKVLNRRAGSAYEIVTLGKAMFTSLGIDSHITAVSDPEQNPLITDFFSPALFSKVILAVSHNGETFYYDPLQNINRFDQVPSNLQGQHALYIKASSSQFFTLPYEAAENNKINYFYNLTLNNSGTLDGTFIIDLEGIKADEAKAIIAEQNTALSASALQNKLQTGTTLRWQKASFNQNEESEALNFTGTFSPRLLAHAPEAGFLLPIKEIFEPIFSPLLNLGQHRYSSFSSLEAALQVPSHFKIAQSKPFNFFIDHKGLRARFLVSYEEGMVVFKGESMVSLPISPEADYKLALPEDQLTIVEIGAKPEAPREASLSNSPENS